ncbi:sex determination protein fruitless-like isoform X9 [Neocloeon triangulifer]|uniref:sex determination protein fruitless-like isoform X9 n=1 Tax=Neocloeon triangulifer TaxID=2078957 RepID=UPI00286FA8F9|nr:sex determination protein fruitless-like isoform X9 [Neocloeon triangulifer]
MASQQYSLRWNNYVRHMTSAFESLRSDRDLIDVTLSCEGKKIPAHKMLLSACSSYFKDLFKENPCQHPVIIFRNVTFDDLMALVDFMYNGEVNVEQEQLASFLNTAELLQVQGLTNSSKDQEKVKKTAKEDERVPASGSHFEEDVEERTSTPTRSGPPAAKKRKWQSPNRTESPAAVLESQTAQGSADGDEDVQSIEQVPLKTETPDYDEDEDIQAGSGVDDTADEQDIVQKLQKSDQLVLTSNRNRTSNNEHSLFGNNSVDMDSGDMSSFGMAGPSNESMGQEGMQGLLWRKERKTKVFETVKGTYQCSECGNSYLTKNQAYYHFYHTHEGNSPCLYGRKTKVNDLKNGLFECGECGQKFETKSKAYYHTRFHDIRSENVCGLCKRQFSTLGNLQNHVKNFHQFGL